MIVCILKEALLFMHQYGETPLHLASKNGCTDVVKLLLQHKANIEAKAGVIYLPLCVLYFD